MSAAVRAMTRVLFLVATITGFAFLLGHAPWLAVAVVVAGLIGVTR